MHQMESTWHGIGMPCQNQKINKTSPFQGKWLKPNKPLSRLNWSTCNPNTQIPCRHWIKPFMNKIEWVLIGRLEDNELRKSEVRKGEGPQQIVIWQKKRSKIHTSAVISAELTPVSSLNSLMTAVLGSSPSSIPPYWSEMPIKIK